MDTTNSDAIISTIIPIPNTVVVHLGAPSDSSAQNVTVSFTDYIKNVASSEIYPTWPRNALIANIYAQITFVLNRFYTLHYRAQGYEFDITNLEAYDQAFINGRDFFENISQIVDEIFNGYITREGQQNPIYPRYCNGTTSQCPGGLSQWGTVDLAEQGYSPIDILKYYYGDDITIVYGNVETGFRELFSGTPLRIGSSGYDVRAIQIILNVISKNYPAIPKIAYPDGYFDVITEDAVKEFQRIFNLTADGIVGKATWYKIIRIYSAVKRLSELDASGVELEFISQQYTNYAQLGSTGPSVRVIQFYLNFISTFNDFIPSVEADSIFGPATESAVRAYQQAYSLPITGAVDEQTWNSMYETYFSILNSLPADFSGPGISPYPGTPLARGSSGENVSTIQTWLAAISDIYTGIPKVQVTGYFGEDTQEAVLAFEREFGLDERGVVGPTVWNTAASLYSDIINGSLRSEGQFPGYVMTEGGEA